MKINYRLITVIVLLFGLLLSLSLQIKTAYGLSDEQRQVFQRGIYYYDIKPAEVTCAQGGTSSKSGPVYFVGDSIGTQIQAGLGEKLASSGWNLKPNSLGSRNLAGQPPSPDGLGAVDADSEFIKSASAVIIELGTNTGGFTAGNVSQMVDKIKTLAPKASIYWVDTAVVQRLDYAKSLSSVNNIIYSQASSGGYKVISWNKKVFGDSADPKNINPNGADNGYIRRADQFVHLTNEGVVAMTDLIASSLSGGGETTGNGCACTLLEGNDNPEKIWNFFITKGLTPPQTAGIMGNVQSESAGTWDPRIVEYAYSDPPHRSDTIPPDVDSKGHPGYGLVQWTGGRKRTLQTFLDAGGYKHSDLGGQLEFIWHELNTAYKASTLDPIKATSSLEEATSIFLEHYEIPANIPGTRPGRIRNASAIMVKYGSGTPTGVAAGSGCN